MNELIELSDPPVAAPEPQIFRAIVVADATGLEPVPVVLPDFSRELTFGPASWMPFVTDAGIFYPKSGDEAIVARIEPDAVWIISWRPSSNSPDHSLA